MARSGSHETKANLASGTETSENPYQIVSQLEFKFTSPTLCLSDGKILHIFESRLAIWNPETKSNIKSRFEFPDKAIGPFCELPDGRILWSGLTLTSSKGSQVVISKDLKAKSVLQFPLRVDSLRFFPDKKHFVAINQGKSQVAIYDAVTLSLVTKVDAFKIKTPRAVALLDDETLAVGIEDSVLFYKNTQKGYQKFNTIACVGKNEHLVAMPGAVIIACNSAAISILKCGVKPIFIQHAEEVESFSHGKNIVKQVRLLPDQNTVMIGLPEASHSVELFDFKKRGIKYLNLGFSYFDFALMADASVFFSRSNLTQIALQFKFLEYYKQRYAAVAIISNVGNLTKDVSGIIAQYWAKQSLFAIFQETNTATNMNEKEVQLQVKNKKKGQKS